MKRTNLKLAYTRPTEHIYGSDSFIGLTRKVGLESPTKFVATVKADGDVVI